MKKYLLAIVFCLMAVAGFSQLSKTDAQGFITRNPPEKLESVVIWQGSESFKYLKADFVSLKALESGYSLVVRQNGIEREKFYPYFSIKYLVINSSNELNLTLRD
ncbi:MAG: hypothetical protein U0176_19430 [Bacteroidia bacterium]